MRREARTTQAVQAPKRRRPQTAPTAESVEPRVLLSGDDDSGGDGSGGDDSDDPTLFDEALDLALAAFGTIGTDATGDAEPGEGAVSEFLGLTTAFALPSPGSGGGSSNANSDLQAIHDAFRTDVAAGATQYSAEIYQAALAFTSTVDAAMTAFASDIDSADASFDSAIDAAQQTAATAADALSQALQAALDAAGLAHQNASDAIVRQLEADLAGIESDYVDAVVAVHQSAAPQAQAIEVAYLDEEKRIADDFGVAWAAADATYAAGLANPLTVFLDERAVLLAAGVIEGETVPLTAADIEAHNAAAQATQDAKNAAAAAINEAYESARDAALKPLLDLAAAIIGDPPSEDSDDGGSGGDDAAITAGGGSGDGGYSDSIGGALGGGGSEGDGWDGGGWGDGLGDFGGPGDGGTTGGDEERPPWWLPDDFRPVKDIAATYAAGVTAANAAAAESSEAAAEAFRVAITAATEAYQSQVADNALAAEAALNAAKAAHADTLVQLEDQFAADAAGLADQFQLTAEQLDVALDQTLAAAADAWRGVADAASGTLDAGNGQAFVTALADAAVGYRDAVAGGRQAFGVGTATNHATYNRALYAAAAATLNGVADADRALQGEANHIAVAHAQANADALLDYENEGASLGADHDNTQIGIAEDLSTTLLGLDEARQAAIIDSQEAAGIAAINAIAEFDLAMVGISRTRAVAASALHREIPNPHFLMPGTDSQFVYSAPFVAVGERYVANQNAVEEAWEAAFFPIFDQRDRDRAENSRTRSLADIALAATVQRGLLSAAAAAANAKTAVEAAADRAGVDIDKQLLDSEAGSLNGYLKSVADVEKDLADAAAGARRAWIDEAIAAEIQAREEARQAEERRRHEEERALAAARRREAAAARRAEAQLGYWGQVGAVVQGYGDAIYSGVEGGLFMVAHPVQSVQGVAHSVMHPIDTANLIFDDYSDRMGTLRGQGSIAGEFLIGVATAGSGSAAAAGASKAKCFFLRTTKLGDGCFVAGTPVRVFAPVPAAAPAALPALVNDLEPPADRTLVAAGVGLAAAAGLLMRRRSPASRAVRRRRFARVALTPRTGGVTPRQLDDFLAASGDPLGPPPPPAALPQITPESPSPRRDARPPARRGWAARAAGLAAAVTAAACFWLARPAPLAATPAVAATTPAAAALDAHGVLSTPIEAVRCGMRVDAVNPDGSGRGRPDLAVDPDTWRLVTLRWDTPEGGLEADTLRPAAWAAARGGVGGEVREGVSEIDTLGPAAIAAVAPCPPIAAGPGRLVTTVYRHTPKPVVDVAVEGEPAPIGATANHPFWSVDRRAFVPAGELRPGERLQDARGFHVAVRGVTPRGPPEPVYNLEVDAEHVYRVGAGGLLVHNSCGNGKWRTPREWAEADAKWLQDTMRSEMRTRKLESGRHNTYARSVANGIQGMIDKAMADGVLEGYINRMTEIQRTFEKRANSSGHRGGGRGS